MKIKINGPKNLVLQADQLAYVLDKLALCPYSEVFNLMQDIFFQLRQQDEAPTTNLVVHPTPTPNPPDPVPPPPGG